MDISHYAYLYILLVSLFFIVDVLWIGVIAKGFYQKKLAEHLGPVKWTPAVLFYLIYSAGVLVFAVLPGLTAASLAKTAVLGAFLGALAYATYELTNYAMLKDWPRSIVVVDILWGALLTSALASATHGIATTFFLS